MMRLKMKYYNTISTEKQQKYQHYHQVKLIIMNTLGGEILPSNHSRVNEQSVFTYISLWNTSKKQIKWYRIKKKNK